MKFRLGCIVVVGVAWFGADAAGIEDEPPPPIRPTVTVHTGDVGGTFFGQKPAPEKSHRYYIAAESVPWDFAPSRRDDVCGMTLPPPIVANPIRTKLRYFEYTDATFTTRVVPNPTLGVLGPVLRGVVGEFLVVTFFNRTTQPLSMHPHGVHYDKNSEGAYYYPNPGRGGAVAPEAKFTYVWHLDENSGPLPGEPSSKGWLYHSHVLGDTETNLGLIGSIIVTDPKRARPDGTPADIDREFATLFMIFDESGLDGSDPNAGVVSILDAPAKPVSPLSWAKVQELTELGSRYAINGYVFGNLRGLDINEGERTRWYLFALGSETDLHTAHWHGLRVIEEGRRRTDVVDLLPATMKVADLVADNPGSWLFHCHVSEHMREGMFARMTVHARDTFGVSRKPELAFLGLPSGRRSIRIDRADAELNLKATPVRADLIIDGVVGAPEAFAVTDQIVRVQLGDRTIEFRLNRQGIGKAPRAMLRVNNIDVEGIAQGGRLDFELVCNGTDWLDSSKWVESPGPNGTVESKQPVTLRMEIGPMRHSTVAQVSSRVN